MSSRSWITEGVPYLRRALEQFGRSDRLPSNVPCYACPCCLNAWPLDFASQILTIEHVPPRALGGKGMLLTCRRCNSESGRKFDIHADRRAAAHGVLTGKGTRPVRATFYADGIPIRGEVTSSGNGLLMQGVPRQNNPEIADAHERALREATERGETPRLKFTITEPFSSRHADVSWVRSAYLAAFATLGWSYILHPALDKIRTQFNSEYPADLTNIMGFNPAAPSDTRKITIVREPESLSSVYVAIGHYTVFLPDPWGTLSLDELGRGIAERRDESGRVSATLVGQTAEWPTKPMHLLDKAI